jgi:chromatin segregation and condensation protein Rec8/ScpA/Scc1 (kleisin family)
MEIIVTFLAMLELMKQRIIDVRQGEVFGEIEVKKI